MKEKEFLSEMISLQIEYNSVLNEQLRIQDQASIFTTDYAQSALNASLALIDAQDNFNKALGGKTLQKFLTDLQVVTGVRSPKFLGLEWWGSRNVYGSLLEEYPELISQQGKFNSELAKTLLSMNDLPDATRQGLEALIQYSEDIEASMEAVNDAILGIVGSIGSDLYNALVQAWDAGTDSFTAFKNTVSQGLKEMVSQMIFKIGRAHV